MLGWSALARCGAILRWAVTMRDLSGWAITGRGHPWPALAMLAALLMPGIGALLLAMILARLALAAKGS
jgi:hypothetical protein